MPTAQQEIEFNDLLTRNYPVINSICLRCCRGNAYYFDELRQECILEIWAEFSQYGLARFRGDSAESTWIFQIAYHAIVHYLRNPKHTEFQCINNIHGTELLTIDENSYEWHLLDELMEQLDNHDRDLLDHYLLGDSYATIAHSEGITEANARQRMSRLIKKLKMLIHK